MRNIVVCVENSCLIRSFASWYIIEKEHSDWFTERGEDRLNEPLAN